MNRDLTQVYFMELRRAMSMARLARYRPLSGSDIDMAVNYHWNIALSEALYPSLSILEVALRNSIHNVLSEFAGQEMWFEFLLQPNQRIGFDNVYEDLEQRMKGPPPPGKVVAELSFGFWVSLLTQPYHQSLWAPDRARLLKAVFPNLPAVPNARRFVHRRFNTIRVLRNRVMHHEPVWNGIRWDHRQHEIVDIHLDIIDAIGWISLTLRDAMGVTDRFPDVHANARARIESNLLEHLGVGPRFPPQ